MITDDCGPPKMGQVQDNARLEDLGWVVYGTSVHGLRAGTDPS
jgi:hypothetical protein